MIFQEGDYSEEELLEQILSESDEQADYYQEMYEYYEDNDDEENNDISGDGSDLKKSEKLEVEVVSDRRSEQGVKVESQGSKNAPDYRLGKIDCW